MTCVGLSEKEERKAKELEDQPHLKKVCLWHVVLFITLFI